MARSMLSFGIFSARALSTARRRRKLESGSLPPSRAAITSSRAKRVKTAPRLASATPFLRLIVDHLECPDMSFSFKKTTFVGIYAIRSKIIPFELILQKAYSPRFRPRVNDDGRWQFIRIGSFWKCWQGNPQVVSAAIIVILFAPTLIVSIPHV